MLGEASTWSLPGAGAAAAAVAAVALVWLSAWTLQWAWWTPRRLERALRAQGLRGTSYRLFIGDVAAAARLNKEAASRPLPLGSHDICPRVIPFFCNVLKEHGKLSFAWTGPKPMVIVTDPDLARQVLSNKSGNFAKKMTENISKYVVGGVVTYEGEKWAKHRRILNPAFHQEKIKRTLPILSTCCTEMITRWENAMSSEGLSELDIRDEFQNLTGDVISRTAFGSSYQEGWRIFQLQEEQAKRVLQAFQRIFIPGYWYLPIENNRKIREIDQEIRTILRGIIVKRDESIRNGETSPDDLLGLFVESNMRESNEREDLGMSSETTSVLLTWTLILLSMHPEWQQQAREEVLHHFGITTPDYYDGLSHLKTVTMILHEVLRLYPPVVFLQRMLRKETELGGIKYPEGADFILPVLSIHHDPSIWGQDASEFNPERFANGVSKATKFQSAFFPFGWGARICIGQSFAMLEAKMALATILQSFSFELSPSYAHAPHTVLTLQPQQGAQIKLKKLR
uniref:Cytochrome P450 n=1 Tax=Leersia perrieri TaxID=77586 RepID=A0A0D9V585_9ORYZ